MIAYGLLVDLPDAFREDAVHRVDQLLASAVGEQEVYLVPPLPALRGVLGALDHLLDLAGEKPYPPEEPDAELLLVLVVALYGLLQVLLEELEERADFGAVPLEIVRGE